MPRGRHDPPWGTPGHGGRGGWGHLPACPRAVAARMSSTRSERGCEALGIFGWQLAERGGTPRWAPLPRRCWAQCRRRNLRPDQGAAFIGLKRTSATKCHGNAAPVTLGRWHLSPRSATGTQRPPPQGPRGSPVPRAGVHPRGGRVDGGTEGRVGGWRDRWIEGWKEGQVGG